MATEPKNMPKGVHQPSGTKNNGRCRIVLTGGPGGGKTTAANQVVSHPSDKVEDGVPVSTP